MERRAEYCQKQILQAIGHWWSLSHALDSKGAYSWTERKKRIIQLALRNKGIIRAKEVEEEFGLVHRTALNWLNRLVKENAVAPIKPKERIVAYQLIGYE